MMRAHIAAVSVAVEEMNSSVISAKNANQDFTELDARARQRVCARPVERARLPNTGTAVVLPLRENVSFVTI
jgi:hypothetical protein